MNSLLNINVSNQGIYSIKTHLYFTIFKSFFQLLCVFLLTSHVPHLLFYHFHHYYTVLSHFIHVVRYSKCNLIFDYTV